VSRNSLRDRRLITRRDFRGKRLETRGTTRSRTMALFFRSHVARLHGRFSALLVTRFAAVPIAVGSPGHHVSSRFIIAANPLSRDSPNPPLVTVKLARERGIKNGHNSSSQPTQITRCARAPSRERQVSAPDLAEAEQGVRAGSDRGGCLYRPAFGLGCGLLGALTSRQAGFNAAP